MILEHVRLDAKPGIQEMYSIVMGNKDGGGIIRAKRAEDGATQGSVVLCRSEARLTTHMPAAPKGSGILAAPVIAPNAVAAGEYTRILQGLILLGIRQLKRQGANAVLIDCVDEASGNSLNALGFEILHEFDEVICDVTNWTTTALG